MNICLPAEIKTSFLRAVKDGKITPENLSNMSPEERHAMFTNIVGSQAASTVNSLFESKLLMKNQEQGFITAIKEIGGLKPAVQRDLISRVQKLDKVLNPAEKGAFMQDLASEKLGTSVNYEQAQKISQLAKDAVEAKAKMKPDFTFPSEDARLKFGASKIELNNYVNDLKLENAKTSIKQTLGGFKTNPLGTTMHGISEVAGFAKGVKASLDDSAIFRQGWKTLFTNPQIWAKNAAQSFVDIARQLGKKADNNEVLDAIKADIYSRPNGASGLYNKMKLDIGNLEEAFPTTLPEKIPLFGRLYKASETAYTGFLYRMRADIADKMVKIANEGGVDMTAPLQQESIGKLVNSLTGRGNLGSLEKVGKTVNTVFFSPKMLKSNLDFLLLHPTDTMSTFARKQAGLNLAKAVTGMAGILSIAYALDPHSVELDPRSADFGKIRVGDTRFDVSGGMGSLLTLAARIVEHSSKSSTTHKVTQLGSGFGQTSPMDVVWNFTENKLSPVGSVIKDLINREDFNHNPITLGGEANNLLTPLPITNALELLQNPKSANPALGIIADSLGIATNTYSKNTKKRAK